MLNEVAGRDVPLHHLPGHEVVICEEGPPESACSQTTEGPGTKRRQNQHLLCTGQPDTEGLLWALSRPDTHDTEARAWKPPASRRKARGDLDTAGLGRGGSGDFHGPTKTTEDIRGIRETLTGHDCDVYVNRTGPREEWHVRQGARRDRVSSWVPACCLPTLWGGGVSLSDETNAEE